MDITPAEERGIFPARVELGEPFEMTAQVFIEGRTKVGATAIVRNPRGKETMRRAMTCVNPGLDRWTVMVTQFRCRVAGPLGRNPGHRPDRTRSQDLGEGR